MNFCIAADVFAICISEIIDSCILAPPLVAKHINGHLSFIAKLIPCTNFSPTTLPIEPPRNLNSKDATTTSVESNSPFTTIIASFSPVAATASFTLVEYFFESLNFSGSFVVRFGAISV